MEGAEAVVQAFGEVAEVLTDGEFSLDDCVAPEAVLASNCAPVAQFVAPISEVFVGYAVADVSFLAFVETCASLSPCWNGVLGFFNHYTCERAPLCEKCSSIVAITGHLHPLTPVPFGCLCRAVCPEGFVGQQRFVSSATLGADYGDLERDGGRGWVYVDWMALVVNPLVLAYNRKDVTAVTYLLRCFLWYLRLSRWGLTENIRSMLSNLGLGANQLEIWACLERGVTCLPEVLSAAEAWEVRVSLFADIEVQCRTFNAHALT